MKKPSLTLIRSDRTHLAWGHAAAAALLAGLGLTVVAEAQAAPDLGGVWVVTKYTPELRAVDGTPPPLLPQAARTYEQRKSQRARGDESFDIVASRCGPPGMPRVMMLPYSFEIVQNPRRVIFLFQWDRMYRRVDLNGPSLDADDLQLSGRSVGHWDGPTLVIDTGQVDDTLLDAAGMPHSASLKITERLHLLGNGTLENRLQFEDPETFSHPWETAVTYRRLPKGTDLGEAICLDRLRTGPAIEEAHYLTYPK